jgi:hypothetical protein
MNGEKVFEPKTINQLKKEIARIEQSIKDGITKRFYEVFEAEIAEEMNT